MRTLLRVLRGLVGLLVLLVLLGGAALFGLIWLTLPPAEQRLKIPGLSAPVDVTFDQDGVARIRAASELDGAAALGFVHARARMAQMELMRRYVSGRLAEIVGPAALASDKMMRTLGLRQAALADYAALPAEVRAMLEAYSRGVNAWIAARGRLAAPEFLLLGTPEPWQPTDCLLWAKMLGLMLSSDYRVELARLSLLGRLSPEDIEALWPPQEDAGHPDARALDVRYAALAGHLLEALPSPGAPFALGFGASNEWAVDARHSVSGAPLLAGDPHLHFSLPGPWYLVRIETPNGVLAGASAPGVPFLVLGHNGHIAWDFSTTGADVQDVFIETQVDATHYLGPDGPLPYGLREERIRVKGQPDVVITVRATRHGPVISDVAPERDKDGHELVLAVQMANLAPNDTAAAGLLALNHAQSVAEAARAAGLISSPVQNLLVADRNHIGLFVTGRVPIRRAEAGIFPVPGADGAHDWVGYASGEQLPHIVDPPSGRLVNANERVAPPGYGIFLGRDWFGDWRARRIRAMLTAKPSHTLEDFAAMQMDVLSTYAAELLPKLKGVQPAPGLPSDAMALLKDWDGSMKRDLPQPLIFNAWLRAFHAAVMHKAGLPEHTPASPDMEFTAYVLSPQGARWCGGDCAPLLAETLAEAMMELARTYGPDPKAWRWGAAHPSVFANDLLAAVPGLRYLARAEIADDGDGSTVNRSGLEQRSFHGVHGASFRGVYDLADLGRSRFIVAPGQSGNLFSRHAGDLLRRWRDGDFLTLDAKPERVDEVLTLLP